MPQRIRNNSFTEKCHEVGDGELTDTQGHNWCLENQITKLVGKWGSRGRRAPKGRERATR